MGRWVGGSSTCLKVTEEFLVVEQDGHECCSVCVTWLMCVPVSARPPTLSLSRRIRSIPAHQSERHALFGLDPVVLAQVLTRGGGEEWSQEVQGGGVERRT